MIKEVSGNILNAPENVIAHQVNCKGVMGSGLALQLRNKYPLLFSKYQLFCKEKPIDVIFGNCQLVLVDDHKYVANLFGQMNYGRENIRYTDYDALERAMISLKVLAQTYSLSIALPHGIGCGLANGNWKVVSKIIKKVFNDYPVTIYKI